MKYDIPWHNFKIEFEIEVSDLYFNGKLAIHFDKILKEVFHKAILQKMEELEKLNLCKCYVNCEKVKVDEVENKGNTNLLNRSMDEIIDSYCSSINNREHLKKLLKENNISTIKDYLSKNEETLLNIFSRDDINDINCSLACRKIYI